MTSPARGAKPDHVFVAPSPGRKVVAVLAVAGVGCLAVALWRAWESRVTEDLVLAGGAAVVVVLCWVFLMVSSPQRVVVTGSVVEVRRGGDAERYDLEDPGVDMLVRDGSVAFGHYRDSWTVVESGDVDWPVFMDVVMRYQSQADLNAEERDRRFSR